MTEYGLTADQLIAKTFRLNRSRRQQYRAYGKAEWRVPIKSIYRTTGSNLQISRRTDLRAHEPVHHALGRTFREYHPITLPRR